MSSRDTFVSLVLPVRNGADYIVAAVEEASQLLAVSYANYELIIVDNGSTDRTLELLQPLLKIHRCIRILRLSRVYDTETAIFAGLENAIGDEVVTLQVGADPIRLLPAFVHALQEGKDIVYGVSKQTLRASRLQRIAKRALYWYMRTFIHLDIPLHATYFLSLNRRTVNALSRSRGRYRNLRYLSREIGFASKYLEYQPLPDAAKLKSQTFRESLHAGLSAIMSHSTHPLRFISRLGLLAALLNAGYGLYTLCVYFFVDDVVPGWTTLSVEVATMFFFLFSTLAVMAEYLGRVLEETRNQPSYHLIEELISDVKVAHAERTNVTHG